MHDEKKPGDVLKVPGDPLDDVADDVRYGIYTFITSSEKPRDLVIAEELRRLAQQGDLTSVANTTRNDRKRCLYLLNISAQQMISISY